MKANVLPGLLSLLLLLQACGGSSGTGPDDGEQQGWVHRPQGREASRQDSTVISLLTDICGMGFAEAMAVDDYRARLGKDWGRVVQILSEVEARFSKPEKRLCMAEGAIVEEGVAIAVTMVLDLKTDMISAAQYESEGGEVQVWTEVDSAEVPALILEWKEEREGVAGE